VVVPASVFTQRYVHRAIRLGALNEVVVWLELVDVRVVNLHDTRGIWVVSWKLQRCDYGIVAVLVFDRHYVKQIEYDRL
jgi:hypothetical protein